MFCFWNQLKNRDIKFSLNQTVYAILDKNSIQEEWDLLTLFIHHVGCSHPAHFTHCVFQFHIKNIQFFAIWNEMPCYTNIHFNVQMIFCREVTKACSLVKLFLNAMPISPGISEKAQLTPLLNLIVARDTNIFDIFVIVHFPVLRKMNFLLLCDWLSWFSPPFMELFRNSYEKMWEIVRYYNDNSCEIEWYFKKRAFKLNYIFIYATIIFNFSW